MRLKIFILFFLILSIKPAVAQQFIDASNDAFTFIGRVDDRNPRAVKFDWPGVAISCSFTGTDLTIHLKGGNRDYYNVFIDGVKNSVLHPATDSVFVIRGIEGKHSHELLITKRTESDMGMGIFYGITIGTKCKIEPTKKVTTRKIEFLGNSITCGYGTEGLSGSERFRPDTENNYLSYASIVARAFNAQQSCIAHSGLGMVRNYNDRSKISTKLLPMPARFGRTLNSDTASVWDFDRWQADAFVINLGTNDYSTLPHPDKSYFMRQYERQIDRVREIYGNIPVFCIAGPMINEPCYSIVKEIVDTYTILHPGSRVYFVGIPKGLLNEKDYGSDYHPNYRGNKKTAAYIVPLMASVLQWNFNDEEYRLINEL
jgi:lysophospholipase L1-like esterase